MYLQEVQSLARQGDREGAQVVLNKKKLVEKEVGALLAVLEADGILLCTIWPHRT